MQDVSLPCCIKAKVRCVLDKQVTGGVVIILSNIGDKAFCKNS